MRCRRRHARVRRNAVAARAFQDRKTNMTAVPPADINEILRHIPHRYPFLLIDRMEFCEPNSNVRVTKQVSAAEWFFNGSGPSTKVMPQSLILEALAQAAGVLCHYSGLMSRVGQSLIFFAGVENLT